MPVFTPVQTSFAAGELSPRVMGRIDLESYYTGAAELKNFICLPHGPLLRRAGTTFIDEARTSTTVRLIPFRYNIDQSFIIELSHKKARFYFKGGAIYSDANHTNKYEVSTPWSASELNDLNYAQSGDILYICHPKYKPRKFARYGNTDWRISEVSFTAAPSAWKTDNWPSCVTFYEQRLYYAATPKQSQTIWGSRVALFDEFTKSVNIDETDPDRQEVLDDLGFEYTIASDDVEGIVWLKAVDVLTAGTSGAEYKITSSSLNEAITPSNIRIVKQTSYGSDNVRPEHLALGTVFVQRGGRRVRLFEYRWEEGQYFAQDLTVVSEHITASKVIDLSLQSSKDTFLWGLTSAGDLIALTYESQQKVIAWHRHVIAGGKVKSMAIIPGEEADEVWLAVARKINGEDKIYIEAFFDAFSEVEDVKDCQFLDSHLSYEGDTAISQIGGLDHLEGETVSVLVDGWVHPDVVVEDGQVNLQASGTTIHIGLAYPSVFESCPVSVSETIVMGQDKRVTELSLSLLKSLGFNYGISGQELETRYMGPTKVMNQAQGLYTGVLKCEIPSIWDKEIRIRIEQNLPLPCIIRAIKYTLEVN